MPLTDFLPYLGGVLSIGITIGGLTIALRSGYSKAAGEIQERVITALKEETEALNRKIQDLERDRDRQNSVLATIRYVLKQRGLKIVIDGDFVTLSESGGKNSKITRIQDRTKIEDEDSDIG